MTNRTAPAHTPATICGKRVRLWDDRIGIVQSAYGTTEGVDSIDVLIVSRPHVGIRRGGAITAAVARQRVVPDLGLDDVTILR